MSPGGEPAGTDLRQLAASKLSHGAGQRLFWIAARKRDAGTANSISL